MRRWNMEDHQAAAFVILSCRQHRSRAPLDSCQVTGWRLGGYGGVSAVFQDGADTPAAPWEECSWLLDGELTEHMDACPWRAEDGVGRCLRFCCSAAGAGIPRSCTARPCGVTMVCCGRRTGRHGPAGQMAGQVIASHPRSVLLRSRAARQSR